MNGKSTGPGRGRGARRASFYCALFLVLAVFIFPFFWMAFNSFKTHRRSWSTAGVCLSSTLDNFKNVLGRPSPVPGTASWLRSALAAEVVLGFRRLDRVRYGHRTLALGIKSAG
jgi:ABC-type glycerol-3-phosphate transport system permease component